MYELKRAAVIREQLKIGDEVLEITIIPEDSVRKDIARKYSDTVAQLFKAQAALHAAQKKNELEATQEAITQYGAALACVMDVLLGAENARKVTAFYDGHVIEMGAHITPYLVNELVPKVKAATSNMRRQARGLFHI